MMAAELKWCYDIACLIHEITERSAATRQKGRKILTLNGRLKNVFSGRQLGLLQEETLVVFYTRMPRETVRILWDEVERRQKFSPRASILFSIESERHRLTGKAWTVYCPVLWLELRKFLTIAGKMKKTVVWLSTSSRVSWLQVWKQMPSWPSLPISTCWMVRRNPARGRKVGGTQGSVAILKEKNVKGCVSQNSDPTNSIPQKVEELGLKASAGHTWNSQDAPGTKHNSGKKKAIWRHHERNPCAPGFEELPPQETSWQADCSSKVA